MIFCQLQILNKVCKGFVENVGISDSDLEKLLELEILPEIILIEVAQRFVDKNKERVEKIRGRLKKLDQKPSQKELYQLGEYNKSRVWFLEEKRRGIEPVIKKEILEVTLMFLDILLLQEYYLYLFSSPAYR